jgi:hypothetical protein
MSIFIKTGYWEKAYKGLKGWLNLDTLIKDIIATYSGTSLTPDEVDAIQASDSPSILNPLVTRSELQELPAGADGKSAYEIWIAEGNVGTEADFLDSLKGEDGNDGNDGLDGRNVPIGDYAYHAANSSIDTIGDWRTYADANGFYTQYCTVGDATKGAGTWVTKFTIQS